MTISIACYIIATGLFVWMAFKAEAWKLPIGLAFFALGHCLVGFSAVFGKP